MTSQQVEMLLLAKSGYTVFIVLFLILAIVWKFEVISKESILRLNPNKKLKSSKHSFWDENYMCYVFISPLINYWCFLPIIEIYC